MVSVYPHYVVWPEPIGWLELTLATAILLSTAGVWWMLLGGCIVLGSVKCVIVLLTGHNVFVPYNRFPSLEAVELLVLAAASVALMLRLWKKPPTIMDRGDVTVHLYSFMWHADLCCGPKFGAWIVCAIGRMVREVVEGGQERISLKMSGTVGEQVKIGFRLAGGVILFCPSPFLLAYGLVQHGSELVKGRYCYRANAWRGLGADNFVYF